MKQVIFSFLLFLMPIMASADDSGSCGNDVTYYYEEATHKLTISGTGMMTNYGSFQYYYGTSGSWHTDTKPWDSYISDIQVVEINEGVTSIGGFSFKDCLNLTTVRIADSVISIGEGAFWGCRYLFSLTLGDGLTTIRLGAFMDCSSLVSIVFPDNVTTIGNYAFSGCGSLASITVPNSLTSIGSNIFNNCNNLTSVHISDIAAWCNTNLNNNLLTEAHHLYLNNKEVKDLVIPEGVTSIGNYTFNGCSSLTSVTIPSSVTSIGSSAFEGCIGLTSVHISDIAAWCNIQFKNNPLAFAHHLYLNGIETTDLVIPDDVTSISNRAFYECSGLTSVFIGNNVTTVGEAAFWGCSSLSSVTFSDNLTSIGTFAFYNCSALSSLAIPNSVNTIDRYAFDGCSGLTNIAISNGIAIISEGVFYGCSSLTSVTLPNQLSTIRSGAFSGCSLVESITIPATVEVIYQNAFQNCTSLQTINAQPTIPPFIYTNTFPNYDITVNVPSGSIEAYQADNVWGNFTTLNDGSVSYQVAITADIHGKATYGGQDVRNTTTAFDVQEGGNAAITITADAGYQIATATINGEDVMSSIVNGVLTISNIVANKTVEVTFSRTSDHTTITIGSAGMATYCPMDDVDFSTVSGLKAYTATGYDHGTLTVSRVLNAPAGTGLLLQGAAGSYDVPYATTTGYYINLLHGLMTDTQVSPTQGSYTNFILGQKNDVVSFYRLSEAGLVAAGKAYLQLPTSVVEDVVSGSRVMRIVAEDETTGIRSVELLTNHAGGKGEELFDLQGRRVTKPSKGLYIVGGQKVVVK